MIVKKIIITILCGVCICFVKPVLANTIYVDQSGGGDYTTITSAINASFGDDTLKVGPGTYEESVVIDKNLALIGSGPNYTSIISETGGIVVQEGITCKIVGFTITSGLVGIYLNRNSNTIIKNNCIVSNSIHGIYMVANDGGNSGSLNTLIINNTIVFNAHTGIADKDYYQSDPLCTIVNNIICYNGDYGLSLSRSTKYISYNNIFNNDSGNYSGCSAGLGDISFNPLFIDANSGNWALNSSSPCVNAGRPGAADADPDGTRNDMGAYAGPDSVAFWPYISGGPVVTEISLTPASAPQGSKIILKAKGRVK